MQTWRRSGVAAHTAHLVLLVEGAWLPLQVLDSIVSLLDDPADVARSALTCRRARAVAASAPLRLRLRPRPEGAAPREVLRGVARSFAGAARRPVADHRASKAAGEECVCVRPSLLSSASEPGGGAPTSGGSLLALTPDTDPAQLQCAYSFAEDAIVARTECCSVQLWTSTLRRTNHVVANVLGRHPRAGRVRLAGRGRRSGVRAGRPARSAHPEPQWLQKAVARRHAAPRGAHAAARCDPARGLCRAAVCVARCAGVARSVREWRGRLGGRGRV